MEQQYTVLKEVIEYQRNFQKNHLFTTLSKENYAFLEPIYEHDTITLLRHIEELHTVYWELKKKNTKEAHLVLQSLILFGIRTLSSWFEIKWQRALPFSARRKVEAWLEQQLQATFQFFVTRITKWKEGVKSMNMEYIFLPQQVRFYLPDVIENIPPYFSDFKDEKQLLKEIVGTIIQSSLNKEGIKVGTIILEQIQEHQPLKNLWNYAWKETFRQIIPDLFKTFFLYKNTLVELASLKPDLRLLETIDEHKILWEPTIEHLNTQETINDFFDRIYRNFDTEQLLAAIEKRSFDVRLPVSNRQRHTYIIGKSGSGKTELLKVLIHKDIEAGNGVFLLDPHGDLAEECFRFRLFEDENFRNRFVYLSPEFASKGVMPKYNPLEYQPKGKDLFEKRNNLSVRALELANGFQAVFKSEFSDNMRSLLINAFKLLLEAKNVHFGHLIELLIPEGDGIAPYHRLISHHWDPMLKNYFLDIFPSKRLNAAKIAIVTRFDFAFSNQALRSMFFTMQSSFNLGKLLDEGKIIIVNAKQGGFSTLGTNILGALMISELTIMALQRANKPKMKRKPVYAYIDECQNFMNEKVDKLLAEGRKYGVHLTMANQFLGQFEGMSRLKQSILANTAIKFCGSSSVQDQIAIGREIRFDFSQNIFLGKGRFVCGIDPYSGIVMQTSGHLIPPLDKNNHYANNKTAELWIEEQIQLYYRPFEEKENEGEKIGEENEKLLPTDTKKKQFRVDEL